MSGLHFRRAIVLSTAFLGCSAFDLRCCHAERPSVIRPDHAEWRNLFNGSDLTGWQANMRPESFSVEDGTLKTHGKDAMAHPAAEPLAQAFSPTAH
jgi:hypothetical protein